MTAPVIAVSQCAGLRLEFGAGYTGNMGISMGRPGEIPTFFIPNSKGWAASELKSTPQREEAYRPTGGQRALAILYQGSH